MMVQQTSKNQSTTYLPSGEGNMLKMANYIATVKLLADADLLN